MCQHGYPSPRIRVSGILQESWIAGCDRDRRWRRRLKAQHLPEEIDTVIARHVDRAQHVGRRRGEQLAVEPGRRVGERGPDYSFAWGGVQDRAQCWPERIEQ